MALCPCSLQRQHGRPPADLAGGPRPLSLLGVSVLSSHPPPPGPASSRDPRLLPQPCPVHSSHCPPAPGGVFLKPMPVTAVPPSKRRMAASTHWPPAVPRPAQSTAGLALTTSSVICPPASSVPPLPTGMPLSPSPRGRPPFVPQHPGQRLLARVGLPARLPTRGLSFPLGAPHLLCDPPPF